MSHLFGKIYTMGRLHSLTDGMYAIVITLLVLDLHTPQISKLTETQLIIDLQEQIHNFITYLISFFYDGFPLDTASMDSQAR